MLASGFSYREINNKFGVPKSTLSTWAHGTHRKSKNEMRVHLALIRGKAVRAIQEKHRRIREVEENLALSRAGEIVSPLSRDINMYKTLLSLLYWAEGSKHDKVSGMKFVNTDPCLADLFISLLRICYKIDESKLRVGLHIHNYHDPEEVRKYWSNLLRIPLSQFYKIYVKPRNLGRRFRRNFVGICLIYYGDSRIRRELLAVGRVFQARIAKECARS